MALWTPAEIPGAIFLDPNDPTTYTVATGVSNIKNKNTGISFASQADTAKQPAVISNGLNGRTTFRWDGSNDTLAHALSITSNNSTIFAVVNRRAGGNATYQYIFAASGPNVQFKNNLAAKGYNVAPWSVCNANWFSSGVTLDTNFRIICSVRTESPSGLQSLFTDGALSSSTSSFNTYTDGVNRRYIGTDGSADAHWSGELALLVIIPTIAVDADIRQRLEGWAASICGLQANLAADHPYKSAAPTIPDTTTLCATLGQPYTLDGTLLRLLDQPYALTIPLLAKLEQYYGLQLLAILAQHYGDVPVVRQYLEQYYGSADLLRRLLALPYGDALQLRQSLVENWNLPGDLLAIMEMRYSISEGDLRVLMSYNYDLSEYTLLRQKLEQIYIAGPDAEEAQEPLFFVTTNVGESLKPHHINIEIDEGEYAIKGEIHLADQNDFLLCKHIETEVIIPIDSTEYHLLVEGPRQSRPEWGRVEYYVPLASKTILLDSPYATPIDQEFTGALASVIVAGLAVIKSITVIWQLIDWYIPTGVLTANNESPLSIIRRVVNAVGGILQSSPAGELICLPEYPISTTEWETATPDFYLTDMDNFFSVDSTSDIREGYNRFLISDKAIDESGLTLEQVDIDENTKDIYVYQVPWNPLERVILHTSGGVWVSIVAEGITTEEITEIVEIIAGEGMTQKPFYSKISHDYKETELGLITINEDKTVSTALSQNSLVEVIYNTKYWKFRVRDVEIEKVQFFPEAIAI